MPVEETHREPADVAISLGVAREEMELFYPALTELVVETSRSKPATATMTLMSRRDENGLWSVQDEELLTPWQSILLEARFGDYREEVMRGYIRRVSVDHPGNAGETMVTVECVDASLGMDREQIRREWGGESLVDDSMILSEITGKYGLTVSGDSGQGQGGLSLLQNSSDNRFLRSRAEANGYEFIISGEELYFGPMRLSGDHQATIFVYSGEDTCCRRISIVDDGHKPDRVAFEAADPEGPSVISEVIEPDLPLLGESAAESAAMGLSDFTWKMSRLPGLSLEELRARAQKTANENSMKIRAKGELDGTVYGHVLKVGRTVQVDGLGERLGGVYYVDQVTHFFNSDGYRQEFILLRNAYGNNVTHDDQPLGGLM